jgi:hypothetical protein
MKNNIPDLRAHDNEFTLEHCSVLLERLGDTLSAIYTDEMEEIVMEADSQRIYDDMTSIMSSKQLSTLFRTEVGKGLILGIFFTHFIMGESDENT